ncbi:MAG: PfkB family carbohydrate kinase, partial [Acinetobacter sp.]|nr:PfkB family carbohydrate kinase [Acinetobacter sp.]
AGDAFSGAFLYALNNGENLQTAAQLAILISSEVVSKFGPRLDVAEYANLLETFKKECA